jgi:hypothetical protein
MSECETIIAELVAKDALFEAMAAGAHVAERPSLVSDMFRELPG